MIHYKDLIIDTEEQRVYRQGEQVHITQTEYRLLMVLLNGAGRVYSRAELLHRVWDVDRAHPDPHGGYPHCKAAPETGPAGGDPLGHAQRLQP